jgi:branched-chain amino acid transport system permease protein
MSIALVSGLTNGSLYGLFAAGFGVIFLVTGRFHYAYGAFYALAGVLAGWVYQTYQWNVWLAAALGIAAGVVGGVLTEVVVYRSFDRRSPAFGLLGVFVASLGIVIALEAAMQLWLNSAPSYYLPLIPFKSWQVGEFHISEIDVVIVGFSWAGLVILSLLMGHTALGKRMRAIAANRGLAVIFGINVNRTFAISFALGSVAAAALGVLYASQFSASSTMGDSAIVYAFLVVFLARSGGPLKWGVIGLVMGVAVSIAGLEFGVEWQEPLVFTVLFVVVAALPYARRLRASRAARSRLSQV